MSTKNRVLDGAPIYLFADDSLTKDWTTSPIDAITLGHIEVVLGWQHDTRTLRDPITVLSARPDRAQRDWCLGRLPIPSVATVTADLFLVSAARQIAHTHCGPAKFSHYFCHAPKRARSTLPLRDFEQV
jgi:hypothetical protein